MAEPAHDVVLSCGPDVLATYPNFVGHGESERTRAEGRLEGSYSGIAFVIAMSRHVAIVDDIGARRSELSTAPSPAPPSWVPKWLANRGFPNHLGT